MTDSWLPPLDSRRSLGGFVLRVLPALAYTGTLFYFGLIRIGALPEVGFVATDKLLHTLAFGGLALLQASAADWLSPEATLRRKLLCGVALSSLLGALLEVCQSFLPFRSADVWDWVADTLGALLAAGSAYLLIAGLSKHARSSHV